MLTIVRCGRQLDESALLSTAKSTLSRFPILNRIFDNFSMFSTLSYRNLNGILSHCAKADSSSIVYLNRVEDELSNLITNAKLKTDKAGIPDAKFVNRLTSNVPSKYLPVLSEIHLADYLLNLFGKNNFSYEEGFKKEKKADYVIKTATREFHLELRTLMKVTTKENIESIFEQVCVGILDHIKNRKGSRNLLFRLDTARLPVDDKLHIDVDGSVNFLMSCFSKLNLASLIDARIQIDFHNISRLDLSVENQNMKVSEILKSSDLMNLFGYDKRDMNTENQLKEWLKTVLVKDFKECPFEFFEVTNNSNDTCISISPIDIQLGNSDIVVPGSTASIMNRTSFIDQLHRAIDAKCESGQRKAGQPSILILDTWDWHYNYFEFESFAEIRKFILEKLRKCPSISGLILFHNIIIGDESYGFHDGRYIENDACNPSIRVTTKDLESLSLIKFHNDPKIRSEENINLNNPYDMQVKKIKEIIEIQPTISLREDKINLISNLQVFLLNSSIDEKIVEDINEIVTEYCFDTDPTGTKADVSSKPEDASICVSYPTVRSLATSCIFRLLKHSGIPKNIELAMNMTRDNNTLVREAAAENLALLHQLDKANAINTARKLLNDNERVRRRIACMFLPYLFNVDKKNCLDLCYELVNIQNSSLIERDETLHCAIDIICVGALKHALSPYVALLDKLVANPMLKGKVKESIAFSCSGDDLTSDKSLSLKIIQIYYKLVLNSPGSSRPDISSRLLHGLVKHELPSFPEIGSLLEILSKEQYPQYSYHVTIINYLSKFGLNFPEQTTRYLKNITDTNTHLVTSSVYIKEIYILIKGLLNTDLPHNRKNELIRILKKMAQNDYVNLNFPEIKEFLQRLKNNTN